MYNHGVSSIKYSIKKSPMIWILIIITITTTIIIKNNNKKN